MFVQIITAKIVDSDGLSSIAGVYGLGSRRSFTAEAVLDSQPVAISANGRRVGEDLFAPEWTDYHTRIHYRTYDVTALVRGPEVTAAVRRLAIPWWFPIAWCRACTA